MRLGAWVMISPTWGFPPRRRQRWGESRLISRITRSTRLRETRMPRQTRSRAQTLRCPSPSQGDAYRSASMATSRAYVRERAASVPGALLMGAQRWPAAGIPWRRTRNGQNPRPHRPAGGRRPNFVPRRGGGTDRRGVRRRKGPDVSVLAFSIFHLHDQLPDPLHGDVQFRLHRIALEFLDRGIDPCDRLLTQLLEPENLHAVLRRQKFHPLAIAVAAGQHSSLRVTVHRWPSPSGPAGETWPGENADERSAPSFTTGPSTATLFSKLSVMFRSSLDTSIKPILCPRKSGPTQIFMEHDLLFAKNDREGLNELLREANLKTGSAGQNEKFKELSAHLHNDADSQERWAC